MSRELIYTSAPRGVKPGSQGFCTVTHTQGMPANLIQQLESLSGYRHIFSSQDSKASLNPTAFSHLVITIAGRRCHVLSRICDAGLDYTQRTNKFAHHVVLDAAEVPAAGPAWLLAQPKFMQSKWAGEPSILPTGPDVPSSESKPRVCRAWQQLTGDAGWAGVLAETAGGATSRQAVLVFQPGMDMLPLLAESLALLPAELRWRVSFSTYFTKLPAGVGCQWRCVVDGTPEAVAARRARQIGLAIDLCHPLGRATGGAYVEAARTGNGPAITTTERLSDSELEYALQETGRPPIYAGVELPASLGVQVPYCDVAPPPVLSYRPRPPRRQLLHPTRKSPPQWPWVLATAALIFVVIGVGVLAWTARFGTNKGTEVAENKTGEVKVAEKKKAEEAKVAEENEKAKTAEDKKKADAAKVAEEKKNACDKATTAAKTANQAAESAKSTAAEGKKVAGEANMAAQAAKKAGADEVAKQAEIAAADATKTAEIADRAADNATQAAKNATQAVKAADSSAKAVLDAAQNAEQAAAGAHAPTEDAKKAVNAARVAIDAARNAVERKVAFEKPLALPPCDSDPNMAGTPLPSPFEIAQLRVISTRGIATLGLKDVFPKGVSVAGDQQEKSLDFFLSIPPMVPRQPIAHLTIEKDGGLTFRWDDRAKNEKAKADLLRNCLLSVNVPGYSTPAIVRLRQAKTVNPLPFSSLGRGEEEDTQTIDLNSVPPNKEVSLRLLNIPRGWTVESSKDDQGRNRCDAYSITVPGDVPLYFDCTVKLDKAKKHKSERRDDRQFDRKLTVVLTYVGTGSPPQVIYQRDKDKKCIELQRELDDLKNELKSLSKEAKQRDESQPAQGEKGEEPIAKLRREIERLKKETGEAKAPKDKEEQLKTLTNRANQLNDKIEQLDRTLKSLVAFESSKPTLHYCLFIKVADKETDYEVELLKTE